MIPLLAVACGCVVSFPFVAFARRELVADRVRACTPVRGGEPGRFAGPRERFVNSPVWAILRRVASVPRRRREARGVEAALRRELPVIVDLVTVAVAAGCTPFHAVEHAARFGPSRIGSALRGVIQVCARGQSFDDALRDLGSSMPAIRPLADALRTSARLGTPAAPALGRLASEVRADVRRRAEARARTVPVRLCFPLVLCVLPAFGLLTVVPSLLGGLPH